ncbi:response regulator [Aquimarina sp. TRL1]|uniref:response regulator n=1 Tax=Aquimarina sp. (strain TRL1) TaxID=2736252 RepID=UPI001589501B|nr:response regulator [Aquimarina sp. TRL1]QKX07351.1 response regulator [Aquimarina sp. TRL1]
MVKTESINGCFFWGMLLFVTTVFSQKKTIDVEIRDTVDRVVYRLVKNDSIVEARMYLDKLLEKGKDNPRIQASYYYNYGVIFLSSGRYNKSLNYFKKARRVSQNIPERPFELEIPSLMLRVYREAKQFDKVDSLYAINISKSLKEKNLNKFYNYNDLIISYMDRRDYKNVVLSSEKALKELDEFDFKNEDSIRMHIVDDIIRNEYKLHLAMGLIEEKKEYSYSYRLLNEVEKDSLLFVKRERDAYLKCIAHYKSRYFYEYSPNIDSVYYYQSLAYRYQKIFREKLKERASNADEFIYEILRQENDIAKLSIINKKNKELSTNFFYISFLISFLLALALLFSIYVYRSNKMKNDINEELKEKNKRLLALNEERSRFFSVINHELRTPIYTIKGLTEIIEQNEDATQRQNYIKKLRFFNNHLLGLVNNTLEYTKFHLGNVRLNKEGFSLKKMMVEITSSFSHQVAENNTELHLSIQKDMSSNVVGDRVKISQVLINLIFNAIKFTPDGNIWLSVRKVKENEESITVYFEVKDDGIGIAKEKLPRIFNGFNGTQHIDEYKGGSGLGLYIVKRIVEDLFQSSIEVSSEEGKGTSFGFEVVLEKCKKEKYYKESINYGALLSEHKILVVDDNKINLMITKKTIERSGAQCDIADNGEQAIQMVKDTTYDVVFMDIHMPGKDGLETTREIREFDKEVVIIALTAVDLENMDNKIKDSGMDDIVIKPFKKRDLFQKILAFSKERK